MNLHKKLSPQTSALILLMAGVATICVGVMFMRRLLHERQLGEESLSWPNTEGIVTRCEYYPGGRRTGSRTEISYRYSVDETVHFSDQATVASHVVRMRAKDFALEHPVGTQISVYYDRRNPGIAVVIPGIDPENTALLYLFGGLLALLSVSCIAYLISFRKLIIGRTVRSHA